MPFFTFTLNCLYMAYIIEEVGKAVQITDTVLNKVKLYPKNSLYFGENSDGFFSIVAREGNSIITYSSVLADFMSALDTPFSNEEAFVEYISNLIFSPSDYTEVLEAIKEESEETNALTSEVKSEIQTSNTLLEEIKDNTASSSTEGLATEATLVEIKTNTDNLESILNTLTKSTDTQPISAITLPLPTGAATEAKQDLEILELQKVVKNTIKFYTEDVEEDTSNLTTYVGKQSVDGQWMIQKIVDTVVGTITTTTLEYATVVNNATITTYADAWTDRATLTYSEIKDLI
jgi:hypothetical protein